MELDAAPIDWLNPVEVQLPDLPDDGCALGGPSCFDCRLPRCIHEMTQGERQAIHRRNRDLARLTVIQEPGRTVEEAAAILGIKVRTVYRILERGRSFE